MSLFGRLDDWKSSNVGREEFKDAEVCQAVASSSLRMREREMGGATGSSHFVTRIIRRSTMIIII